MSDSGPDSAEASTAGVASPGRARPTLERGALVDRYVILDPLGSGGMGVVYKAFDPELGRPVALKLLNSSEGAAGVFRERLLREAQALARLSHPNVIAVHDVGTFGDDVFIAMEFVEGQTLRQWLKQSPRSQRQILEVLLGAGEGLAAAHLASLVHRDFKPDNVIVGNDGRVRVLDFGLARVATGELDECAAPGASAGAAVEPLEQTSADCPAAKSGDHPAAAAAAAASASASAAAQAKSTDQPSAKSPSPKSADAEDSTRPGSSVRGASLLLASLTRAGAVMGTPRYMAPEQHLGEVADERADQFSFCVSLYQALYGELPFESRSEDDFTDNVIRGRVQEPPAGTHVPRWLRQVLLRGLAANPAARHPSMAALLQALRADPSLARGRWLRTAGVLALLGASVVTWRVVQHRERRACQGAESKLVGVWDDEQRAAVRAAFRATGKPFAEAALGTVERVFDRYAKDWVAMHVDTCEATHVRGEQSQEMLDLRMTCLSDRLTQLKTLSELYATADSQLVERAAQSAQSLPGLGPCADASALRAPIPPPSDAPTLKRVDQVRKQLARASALQMAGRYDEGLGVTRPALEAAQSLHYAPVEAEAQLRLGELLGDHGDYPDSSKALHEAFVVALAGHHEEAAARAASDLIQAIGARQARYEEGDRWAKVAEALAGRLSRKDELLGALYTKRSQLDEAEGRYEESFRDATRALELKLRVFGPDHSSVAETYYYLGHISSERAQYAQALDSFEHSLSIQVRLLGPDHPKLIPSLSGLAGVYSDKGDFERAVALFERALSLVRRLQADHPYIPILQNNTGYVLLAAGRPHEAKEMYQHALGAFEKQMGPSMNTASVLANLGEVELTLNQPNEALAYLTRAHDMCERVLGASHSETGRALADMGEAYRLLGKPAEALDYLKRGLAIGEKALGPKHPQLAMALLGIARTERSRNGTAAAIAALERALAIREAEPGDRIELSHIRFELSQLLWAAGDRPRAIQLTTEAREAYAKANLPTTRQPLAAATAWLAHHH